MSNPFDDMQRTLAMVGVVCVVTLTVLVLVMGIGALTTMGDDHQGGRYYVGAALVIALVCLVNQYFKFASRFRR